MQQYQHSSEMPAGGGVPAGRNFELLLKPGMVKTISFAMKRTIDNLRKEVEAKS